MRSFCEFLLLFYKTWFLILEGSCIHLEIRAETNWGANQQTTQTDARHNNTPGLYISCPERGKKSWFAEVTVQKVMTQQNFIVCLPCGLSVYHVVRNTWMDVEDGFIRPILVQYFTSLYGLVLNKCGSHRKNGNAYRQTKHTARGQSHWWYRWAHYYLPREVCVGIHEQTCIYIYHYLPPTRVTPIFEDLSYFWFKYDLEVPCTPSLTWPGFEPMTSRPWQYISCSWDDGLKYWAIRTFF